MADRNDHPPQVQDIGRRRFFKVASGVLAGFVGVVFGIPLIGSLIGPSFRKKPATFSWAASVESLPGGRPVVLSFTDETSDAYRKEMVTRNAWAVKRSAEEVTVYSPICTHLGCRVDWEERSGHFLCPCHGSVFAMDGMVLAGPAPRPLDTLPAKVENGNLYVEWERFRSGTRRKIPV